MAAVVSTLGDMTRHLSAATRQNLDLTLSWVGDGGLTRPIPLSGLSDGDGDELLSDPVPVGNVLGWPKVRFLLKKKSVYVPFRNDGQRLLVSTWYSHGDRWLLEPFAFEGTIEGERHRVVPDYLVVRGTKRFLYHQYAASEPSCDVVLLEVVAEQLGLVMRAETSKGHDRWR